MSPLRTFFRTHRRLAGLLFALVLVSKIFIPSGYMPLATGDGLVLMVCSGMAPSPSSMTTAMPGMPGMAGQQHEQKGDKAESPCSFAGLSAPFVAGADPVLLAIALGFVLAFGWRALPRLALPYRQALRPPLRGPPAAA